MTGETRGEVSGWTVDTLHVYLVALINSVRDFVLAIMNERNARYEQRFAEIIEAQNVARNGVETALLAQQRVALRGEEANEKRFQQLADQRRASDDKSGTMMPRNEAAALFAGLEQQIRQLEKGTDKRFTDQGARLDRNDGRSTGVTSSWGMIFSVIGGIVGLLMIAAFFLTRTAAVAP